MREVLDLLRDFVMPVLQAGGTAVAWSARWLPGGRLALTHNR